MFWWSQRRGGCPWCCCDYRLTFRKSLWKMPLASSREASQKRAERVAKEKKEERRRQRMQRMSLPSTIDSSTSVNEAKVQRRLSARRNSFAKLNVQTKENARPNHPPKSPGPTPYWQVSRETIDWFTVAFEASLSLLKFHFTLCVSRLPRSVEGPRLLKHVRKRRKSFLRWNKTVEVSCSTFRHQISRKMLVENEKRLPERSRNSKNIENLCNRTYWCPKISHSLLFHNY